MRRSATRRQVLPHLICRNVTPEQWQDEAAGVAWSRACLRAGCDRVRNITIVIGRSVA